MIQLYIVEYILTNKIKEVLNEVNYHIVPDLEPHEIAEMKKRAIDLNMTVKELVRQAILYYLVIPEIKGEDGE